MVRQYKATDLTATASIKGPYEYPAAPMTNGEMFAAAITLHWSLVPYPKDQWYETAFSMCYRNKEGGVKRCTGMIMLQKDLLTM